MLSVSCIKHHNHKQFKRSTQQSINNHSFPSYDTILNNLNWDTVISFNSTLVLSAKLNTYIQKSSVTLLMKITVTENVTKH